MISTRSLLACGAVAGPLFVIVGFGQAFTRQGFDLRRHALSLLSNGDLGWIQIANFLASGALVLAFAVGLRRVLQGRPAGTWGPWLVGAYGAGLIGGGIFVADPALGFPPGTPDGPPAVWTWHSTLHFVSAAIAFLSLIAGCFVFARAFARGGERGWALYSLVTGVIFLASFAALASGGGNAVLSVAFAVAVVLAWGWLAALSTRLMNEPSTRGEPARDSSSSGLSARTP